MGCIVNRVGGHKDVTYKSLGAVILGLANQAGVAMRFTQGKIETVGCTVEGGEKGKVGEGGKVGSAAEPDKASESIEGRGGK